VLPSSIRLTDVHLRLPRYYVAMLEHLAERERTSVSTVLTRELDGIDGVYAEELTWSVAGFEAALQWPDAEAAQPPC